MNIRNKDHISIDYDITRACNNRCSYCCEMNYLDNTQKFNAEVFEQVISSINLYKHKGKISVSLLGGDPLVIPERVQEFVQRISADVNVYSNLNYPPDSKHINLVKDLDCTFTVSWHDSSNSDFVKENIIILKGKITPILMLRPENLDEMLENSKWLMKRDILYKVQFIRNELNTVQANFEDQRVQEIFAGSVKNTVDTIDNETFNEIESLQADLMNIATRYKVLCRLYMCRIKYDGKIETLCNNPTDYGNIKDGLNFKEVMCFGCNCLCDTRNYKRILA